MTINWQDIPRKETVKCGADVSGQGAKLSWSQADNPARGIELKRGKIYYLNHQLLPIGDGKKPTRSVSFIRNASTQGEP